MTHHPAMFDIYEVQRTRRNRGMPLEALALDTTPVGMHYLLAHFDIPIIDPAMWTLSVRGEVRKRLLLTLDELRRRPQTEQTVTIECAGNGRTYIEPRPAGNAWGHDGVSTARWSGITLSSILHEAGPLTTAREVVFTGADFGVRLGETEFYQRALPLTEATSPDMLLALDMAGQPLEPQHGSPLRLVAPGWYGMAHVKWLTDIEIIDHEFEGPQQEAYRITRSADEYGEPVTRIKVRALMIPPGYPDSTRRHRFVRAGTVPLRGRAWSGVAPIEAVEVGVDGAWGEAEIEPSLFAARAWQRWTYAWDAERGDHLLTCRATDSLGNTQPLEPTWNLRGLANNAVQQVAVTAL